MHTNTLKNTYIDIHTIHVKGNQSAMEIADRMVGDFRFRDSAIGGRLIFFLFRFRWGSRLARFDEQSLSPSFSQTGESRPWPISNGTTCRRFIGSMGAAAYRRSHPKMLRDRYLRSSNSLISRRLLLASHLLY